MFGFLKNLLRKPADAPVEKHNAPPADTGFEAEPEQFAEEPQPARAVSPRQNGRAPAAGGGGYGRPAPRTPAPAPAPQAQGQSGRTVQIPLQPVLDGLPLELQPRIVDRQAGDLTISIPLEKVLSQLSRGSVKITFGELRQLASGIFSNDVDRDRVAVPLPLSEILARLNPALIARRRVQKHVEVPAEISSPFDPGNQGLIFNVGPSKPEPASSPAHKPATPSRPATPQRATTPAQPAIHSAPPRSSITSAPTPPPPSAAAAAPPSIAFTPRPAADLRPRPAAPAAPGPKPSASVSPIAPGPAAPAQGFDAIPSPFRMNPAKPAAPSPAPAAPAPGLNQAPVHPSSSFHAPAAPAAPSSGLSPFSMPSPARNAAAPSPAPVRPTAAPAAPVASVSTPAAAHAAPAAPHRPAVEQETLIVPITSVAESWPEPVRKEVVQLGLVDAKMALPLDLVNQALKQGRIAFPWKNLRGWIKNSPTPVSSPNDGIIVELPLKVVAPLFLNRQKEGGKDHQKVNIDAEIPNLFFGFPQGDNGSNSVTKPADTNYYVWDDKSDTVHITAEDAKKPSIETRFLSKCATPNEVVSRAAALDGVAGALVALPDGLMVASRLSSDLNGETLAAFLPQIFGKVTQCTKELRMGELNNLHFTVGNVPWKIFRVNAIFFAAFGRPGEAMPTAQLSALAAELDHKPK